MNKSITAVLALSLLCFQDFHAAHAATGPLDSIDSRLIFDSFPVETGLDVATESVESQTIPGCSQVKTFQVFEANVPGQVIVAMCQEGEFGPRSIEATLFKRVAEAKEVLRKVPSPLAKSMLEGAEPVTVSLEGGKQGRALTLPYIGHGFALVPLAYAVTLKKDATIVVHAYLNPNAPRDLTKPIAALLQGIYKRLQQDGS
jgi:hypothetical protein